MAEDISSIQLDKADTNLNLVKQLATDFTFYPIQEIGIQLDSRYPEDEQEVKKLLGDILRYPSSELAEMHAEAMKIGIFDLESEKDEKEKMGEGLSGLAEIMEEEIKICPCCGFRLQTDTIKICTPLDKIKNIGASTQLYFATFKSLGVLLGAMFLVYSIYSLVSNWLAAKDNKSISSYLKISLAAKQLEHIETNETLYYIQCWLGLVTMMVWILMMMGIKYFEIKEAIEYDVDTSSCSDYSIVLEGIPLDVT